MVSSRCIGETSASTNGRLDLRVGVQENDILPTRRAPAGIVAPGTAAVGMQFDDANFEADGCRRLPRRGRRAVGRIVVHHNDFHGHAG
jgi:hypothetical protein